MVFEIWLGFPDASPSAAERPRHVEYRLPQTGDAVDIRLRTGPDAADSSGQTHHQAKIMQTLQYASGAAGLGERRSLSHEQALYVPSPQQPEPIQRRQHGDIPITQSLPQSGGPP